MTDSQKFMCHALAGLLVMPIVFAMMEVGFASHVTKIFKRVKERMR